jgi:hypothetical protein
MLCTPHDVPHINSLPFISLDVVANRRRQNREPKWVDPLMAKRIACPGAWAWM